MQVFPLQPLRREHIDDTTPRPVLVAQLELPRFYERVVVSAFDVRPDPAFPAHGDSNAFGTAASKSFTQDPSKGLLVFDLQVLQPPQNGGNNQARWPSKSYELFLLRETLVDLAQKGEERLEKSMDQAQWDGWGNHRVEEIIPWSDWGTHGSRLMNISMKRRSWVSTSLIGFEVALMAQVCSCSGYRFASLYRGWNFAMYDNVEMINHDDDEDYDGPDDDEDDDDVDIEPTRSDIRIYDFSPYHVRKELAHHPMKSTPIRRLGQNMRMLKQAMQQPELYTQGGEIDIRGIRYRLLPDPKSLVGKDKPHLYAPTDDRTLVLKRVVTEKTRLPKKRIWAEEVETYLPYVEITRREQVRANGVIIDDQRIIAIAVSLILLSYWRQSLTARQTELPDDLDRAKSEQKMTFLCM